MDKGAHKEQTKKCHQKMKNVQEGTLKEAWEEGEGVTPRGQRRAGPPAVPSAKRHL